MAPAITVDPDQIEDAADVFGSQVATDVYSASATLAFGMAGGLAGNDAAGNAWSSSYDRAVTTVMGATADVVNGSYKLASMLLITGDNHRRADLYSRTSSAGAPVSCLPRLYVDDFVSPFDVPASGGAHGREPTGWSLIQNAVGYAWPGGHQDSLRASARAWGAAAGAVDQAGWQIPGATAELILNESPEIGTAYVVSRSMGDHLTTLAGAYVGLQVACNDYADYLDRAHRDAEHELNSLIEWTVGIEAAGVLASAITFGGAEVAAQAVEAGRIAATAVRIGDIIRSLIAAVDVATQAVAGVVTQVADVSRVLKGLLGARLSRATAEVVSRLPGGTETAEEIAETDLFGAAQPGVKDGWVQRPARNGKGQVWQEPGMPENTNFNSIRFADPDRRYPDGCVRFYNADGQPLDLNGKPGSMAATHIPRRPDGSYPLPKGW